MVQMLLKKEEALNHPYPEKKRNEHVS